ncbi:NB-ARC domains-containing protein [Tanacetum coccineum]
MLSQCCNLLSLVDSSEWDVDEELGGENTKKQIFSKLEHLFLLGLDMLQVLWKCPDQYISLKNLVTIYISDCNKLVRLFSVNVARGLVNLQTLKIKDCDNLKEVIWEGDEGDNDMVEFRCLVKIELLYLINLKSFYAGKVKISYPSLEEVEIRGCDVMDKWDNNGTYHTPILKLVNQVEQTALEKKYRKHVKVVRAAMLLQSDGFPPACVKGRVSLPSGLDPMWLCELATPSGLGAM